MQTCKRWNAYRSMNTFSTIHIGLYIYRLIFTYFVISLETHSKINTALHIRKDGKWCVYRSNVIGITLNFVASRECKMDVVTTPYTFLIMSLYWFFYYSRKYTALPQGKFLIPVNELHKYLLLIFDHSILYVNFDFFPNPYAVYRWCLVSSIYFFGMTWCGSDKIIWIGLLWQLRTYNYVGAWKIRVYTLFFFLTHWFKMGHAYSNGSYFNLYYLPSSCRHFDLFWWGSVWLHPRDVILS